MTREASFSAGHRPGLPPDEGTQTLLPLWRRVFLELRRRIERWGISSNAAFVLLELHLHPDRGEPSALAEAISLPRQTMTFVLDQLERKDMLRRALHPSDRRRRLLQITPRGTRMARRILDDIVRFESMGLAAIPPSDVSKIRAQLGQYADALARQNAQEM